MGRMESVENLPTLIAGMAAGASATFVGVSPEDVAEAAQLIADVGRRVVILDIGRIVAPDLVLRDVTSALRRLLSSRGAIDAGRCLDLPPKIREWASSLPLDPGRCPPLGTPQATEARVYARLLSDPPPVLCASIDAGEPALAAAVIHVLRWYAATAGLPSLFLAPNTLPPRAPFDAIFHGTVFFPVLLKMREEAEAAARTFGVGAAAPTPTVVAVMPAPVSHGALGGPDPDSDVEVEMHRLVTTDPELGGLFAFNVVRSLNGGTVKAKPDAVWDEGRLVVEYDGLEHFAPSACVKDRIRDYHFMLAGYRVLRISNSEFLVDPGATLEKIRRVVRMLRDSDGGGTA